MSVRKSSPSRTKPSPKARARRDSAAEIEHVLEIRGVAPLAEKALSIGDEIGKGKFKKVHKGWLKQKCGKDCTDVVIVQYKKQGSEVNELTVLAQLAGNTHGMQFVPELFGVVDQRTIISVVQERAAYGTLKSAFESPEVTVHLTMQHKLNMAKQVALGLDFLQSVRIVHADLACRNMLLFNIDEDPTSVSVKITDFGLALILQEDCTSEIKKQPQATRWCSPETVASNKYSHQSDIWSLGVSLWELFTDGAAPWTRFEKRSDVTAMLTELATHADSTSSMSAVSVDFPVPDSCPMGAYEIVLACLQVNEKERPTAALAAEQLEGLLVVENSPGHSTVLSPAESMPELSNSTEDDVESTVSTEASKGPRASEVPLTMKLVRDLSQKFLETANDECASVSEPEQDSISKLKAVSDFLWSPYARSVLGDTAVQSMQKEVVQAMEAQQNDAHNVLGPGGAPVRDVFLPVQHGQGPVRCWAASAPLSIWTLWSLAENDMLRRQDFVSEAAARAAVQANGARSRLLRGPHHDEVYTCYPVAM